MSDRAAWDAIVMTNEITNDPRSIAGRLIAEHGLEGAIRPTHTVTSSPMKHALGRALLAAVLSIWLTTSVWAGFDEGLAAARRGDYATALEEWLPVANGGHAEVQAMLGVMYFDGRGVPQDYAEALRWYHLAAEQGLAVAQLNLGVMYGNGQGVPKDQAEEMKWYLLAAEQGHAVAQSNLGLIYSNGQGVPQDYVEAVKWYRKAAEQNNTVAQFNLGFMYAEGKGVPQDYVQAHIWFDVAAAKGHEDAHHNRDLGAKQMTPAHISEAQHLAREWLEEHGE